MSERTPVARGRKEQKDKTGEDRPPFEVAASTLHICPACKNEPRRRRYCKVCGRKGSWEICMGVDTPSAPQRPARIMSPAEQVERALAIRASRRVGHFSG